MNHIDAHAESAIWTAVVGLASGETVKIPGLMTHKQATKAADAMCDKMQAEGQPVAWSAARRETAIA